MHRHSNRRNSKTDAIDGNILNHKRGLEQVEDPLKKLRLLENLRTNNTVITCCDFGADRESLFPNHFFCHGCKDWENRNRENKRLHRGMKSYKCSVNHTNFTVPTESVTTWCPSLQKNQSKSTRTTSRRSRKKRNKRSIEKSQICNDSGSQFSESKEEILAETVEAIKDECNHLKMNATT